jgi:hypothetical protein
MKKTPPILVRLRWLDAHVTASATYELHELPHRGLEIITYGLLLRDDADGVSIASEDCGGGAYRGVTFVPRSLVVECKPVKPARSVRKPKPATKHDPTDAFPGDEEK